MPTPKQFIVGREAEIERFDRLVAGKEKHWLLNIYGPGGIGKTVVCNRLMEHAANSNVLAASVDGIRPDLTPDRILHFFQEGLTQGKLGERLEGAFDDFVGQFEDYLTINEVLRQGGGVPEMFDVVGNVKDPAGLTKILAELGKTVSENVRTTVNNRFALERYLRGVERFLTSAFAEGITIAQDKAQRPIVLFLDTYEELEALDDWSCRMLMPALPEGVKVVILGRNDLHRINFDWEEFGLDLHAMPLPELSETDAKAYLYHYGLQDPVAQAQVYTFTGGYPLLLVLVRHLAQEHGGWDALQGLERSADRDHIATELLNRILREERTEDVRAFLERGVVARWFTPEIIGLVLEIGPDESRVIYDKLRRHSFVEPHPYGLKFHDKIRELLLERFKFNKLEYDQLVKRLMAYYAEKAGIDPDDPTTQPARSKYEIHIQSDQGGLVIGDQTAQEPTTSDLNQDKDISSQPSLKYDIYIQDPYGLTIGDTTIHLSEMLAFDKINPVDFTQGLASLLGLSRLSHNASYQPDVYPALFDATSLFRGLKALIRLPLLFIKASSFLQMPEDELRGYLDQIVDPAQKVAVFIYWTELNSSLERIDRQTIFRRLQRVWAYDCVILGSKELRKIVFSRNPQEIFRKFVFSQVDLSIVTPFVATGGPTSDDMFFGREHELRSICSKAVQANFVLIGGRQIGKTSFLRQLESVRLPATGFRTFFHDCSYTPSQTELIQELSQNWFSEPLFPVPSSLAEIIQMLPTNKRVVILLDEVDKLIEPDQQSGYSIFKTFRALSNAGRCRFILAGERALRAELVNPESPLYNFANKMLIGRLEPQAVEELVTQPMKRLEIEFADETEIVQRVWGFTSGHPKIVQSLCHNLILRLNQREDHRLTLEDVEGVMANPAFLREEFLNVYWERATALERLCSLEMAADDDIRTLMSIHKALTSRDIKVGLNEIDDALERLVDLRNILQRTASGYEFAVTAFPEVIAKTHRLDDLIALNCETYQQYGDIVPGARGGR